MSPSRGSRPAAKPAPASSPPAGDLRWRIGAIALVLLAMAGYLAWQEFYEPQEGNQPAQWFAAALRVGLVMAAIWLAWPELRKLSPWFLGLLTVLLPITLIVIAKWPRYLPVFLIGGFVLYILRPRGNRRVS
jgi:cytochrome bd-type quinol oxidase subunit 2